MPNDHDQSSPMIPNDAGKGSLVSGRVHSARRSTFFRFGRPFARPKMAMRVDYRFQVIVLGKIEAECRELCKAFVEKPVNWSK